VYGDLYKAWKSEKSNSLPQPLPEDLYHRTTMYLRGLDEELATTDRHTIQGRLLVKEKEVTERLLQELKQARLQKILSAAQNHAHIQTTSMTENESNLIARIEQTVLSLDQPLQASSKLDETGLIVVRILEDLPEIVGVDLRIYGPFKKEDVVSLPEPNARALEKQGAAKAIEVKNFPKGG